VWAVSFSLAGCGPFNTRSVRTFGLLPAPATSTPVHFQKKKIHAPPSRFLLYSTPASRVSGRRQPAAQGLARCLLVRDSDEGRCVHRGGDREGWRRRRGHGRLARLDSHVLLRHLAWREQDGGQRGRAERSCCVPSRRCAGGRAPRPGGREKRYYVGPKRRRDVALAAVALVRRRRRRRRGDGRRRPKAATTAASTHVHATQRRRADRRRFLRLCAPVLAAIVGARFGDIAQDSAAIFSSAARQ
jgi:hypothetical protein